MSADKIAALRDIAGPVSRETEGRLLAFEREFIRWAGRINFVASSTLPEIWQRHVLDSAQLVRLAPEANHFLDLGSGGGFPGLILAFLLMEKPGSSIDLVESNRKKAGFLQAMVGQFGLPARVHALRVEEAASIVTAADIVTARALAPLASLLDLAEPWLSNGATGLFHKGRDYRREVEESAHHWNLDLLEHQSRIDKDSVILEVNNLQRRS